MRTFQSPRNRWADYNARPGSFRRRQAAREAASMAGPCPVYPADAPLTGDWLGGRINGHTVIMALVRLPSHRCYQWCAWIDGELVADAAGLTRLWALLKDRWHGAPSLEALASMRQGYTARDEQDARNADSMEAECRST
jgi:hypothetical protein